MKFCIPLLYLVTLVSASAQQLRSEYFSVKSGLPQSQVTSLAEDKKFGYLWVGTSGGGAAQFDGHTFKTYTVEEGLLDNAIDRIFIDSRDDVWFATPKGLTRFDGKKFKNFELPLASFTALFEHRDTLIAISRNFGNIKIVGDSLFRNTKEKSQNKVTPLYVTVSPNQLYILEGDQLYYEDENQIRSSIDISALGILYSFRKNNNQPFLITSKGTYRIKGKIIELVDARVNFSIMASNKDYSVVWRWSENNLIEVHLGATVQYDTIMKNTRIITGLVDSEGNSWFGTDGKGLLKRHATDFEKIYNDIGMSVVENGEQLWIGSHGLKVFENGKLKKQIPIINDQGVDMVSALKRDGKGNIWAIGGLILTQIPVTGPIEKYSKEDGLHSSFINDIEIDKNDRVWISYRFWSRTGVDIYDKGVIKGFEFNDKLSSRVVVSTKYIPYGDRMLFLTENGVDQFVHGAISKLKISKFEQTAVYCAVPYKKNMAIIGSEGRGICVYNFDTDIATYFSVNEGLASGLIYFLNVDDEGYVWIGSNRGIERILFNENLEIQEYLHFAEANGLTELETNFNASYFSGNKKYFGLIDGLYRYVRNERDSIKNFGLHFTGIDLINSKNDIASYGKESSTFFEIPTELKLPSDENSLKFSFSKVSKKFPNSSEYKFMLEGVDKEWSRQSTEEVTYRNLANGDYTFKVLARNLNGKWMEKPLVYSFTILPPFYKQPLFVVAGILLILSIIIYVNYTNVQRKVKRILQLEKTRLDENIKLRKEIGSDFHDEIGNQLARIVNYVGMIKLNQGDSRDTLTKVEESAQNLIGGTKDFVWALDHTNDSSTSLFIHLKDFGDRLFDEKGIEFRAFNELEEDTPLPIGHTRQINLIFKEAMTNAFKYSHATRVNMYFRKVLFKLTIIVEDNGLGFPEEKLNPRSGGLSHMKTRANRINAKLVILPNTTGTQIKLIVES